MLFHYTWLRCTCMFVLITCGTKAGKVGGTHVVCMWSDLNNLLEPTKCKSRRTWYSPLTCDVLTSMVYIFNCFWWTHARHTKAVTQPIHQTNHSQVECEMIMATLWIPFYLVNVLLFLHARYKLFCSVYLLQHLKS